MTIVFASNNLHKVEEVKNKLRMPILSLKDIKCFEEIPETGNTFEENAFIKANHVYTKYKKDCFADDSGLVIEALDGEPGVYSARYAGEYGNGEANMDKVLLKMKNKSNRKAKFVTVICLILKGETHYFRGEINGIITGQKMGSKGFGYDPIFLPDGSKKTFAEMSLDDKSHISHRALALRQMQLFLKGK